jgi:hypothetical protein
MFRRVAFMVMIFVPQVVFDVPAQRTWKITRSRDRASPHQLVHPNTSLTFVTVAIREQGRSFWFSKIRMNRRVSALPKLSRARFALWRTPIKTASVNSVFADRMPNLAARAAFQSFLGQCAILIDRNADANRSALDSTLLSLAHWRCSSLRRQFSKGVGGRSAS